MDVVFTSGIVLVLHEDLYLELLRSPYHLFYVLNLAKGTRYEARMVLAPLCCSFLLSVLVGGLIMHVV